MEKTQHLCPVRRRSPAGAPGAGRDLCSAGCRYDGPTPAADGHQPPHLDPDRCAGRKEQPCLLASSAACGPVLCRRVSAAGLWRPAALGTGFQAPPFLDFSFPATKNASAGFCHAEAFFSLVHSRKRSFIRSRSPSGMWGHVCRHVPSRPSWEPLHRVHCRFLGNTP